MLDYPNDFDTKVFPESRGVAMSRALAMWSLIAFFVIAVLCGIILWSAHSKRRLPVMISMNTGTGEWSAIIGSNAGAREISADVVMQESVASRFAKMWFAVANDSDANDVNWAKCGDAKGAGAGSACFLCCMSSGELYQKFAEDVLPNWRARADSGETLHLVSDSIMVTKISATSKTGGLWRVGATLRSNRSGDRPIEAYIRIAREPNARPMTLNFYVSDFNAYLVTSR